MKFELVYGWLDKNISGNNYPEDLRDIKQFIETCESIYKGNKAIKSCVINAMELYRDNKYNGDIARAIAGEVTLMLSYGCFDMEEGIDLYKEQIDKYRRLGLSETDISIALRDIVYNGNQTIYSMSELAKNKE